MTDALTYFSTKLALETDASDVYAAQKAGESTPEVIGAAAEPPIDPQ